MLPLGYSFNLDGSMMYMSFATIFIAQAYGIELTIGTQIMILLTLMISSKGIAAVPRASLVVITGTLAMFGLPVEASRSSSPSTSSSTWAAPPRTSWAMRWQPR